jgi:Ca-activated chloride channel homolog
MASPATLEAIPLHRSARPGSAVNTHVLLRVRARPLADGHRRPRLTAVLVLDTSSSMEGEPLTQVIRTAQRLTRLLSPEDRLAIVAFADGARVVTPLSLLTEEARASMITELGKLRAMGQTNLSGGMAHAALLMPRRVEGEQQLMVVLSDGQPNLGAVKPEELEEAARLVKGREVAISTLGYGAHHNETVLSRIADAAGGRYAFVADPLLAESNFVRALGAQLDVVGEGVKLFLNPHEGVEIVRIFDAPRTSYSSRGLAVELPDLVVGDELNIVVQLRAAPVREAGSQVLLEAALEGRVGGLHETFCEPAVAAIRRSEVGALELDLAAQSAVLLGECVEARTEARKLADKGAFAQAVDLLERAKRAVEEAPGFVADAQEPLNDARDTLIDEIALLSRAPKRDDYERYKKASLDYADFGTSSVKRRGGARSPTTLALDAAAAKLARGPRPNAFLVGRAGPANGQRWALKDQLQIGRASANDIALVDFSVTRCHASIQWEGSGYMILDMGSTNGVYVNQRKVHRHLLKPDDEIRIGVAVLRYEETK